MTAFWLALLKPLIYLALFALIVWPLMWLVWKVMPDSKVKRVLFDKKHEDLAGYLGLAFFVLFIVVGSLTAV